MKGRRKRKTQGEAARGTRERQTTFPPFENKDKVLRAWQLLQNIPTSV